MRRPSLFAPFRALFPVVFPGVFAALAACSSHHPAHAAHHWSYAASEGPEHWCDLDPANTACCKGQEQSPIDVLTSAVVTGPVPKLELVEPPASFTVANNGHTLQATQEKGGGSGIVLGGTKYTLQQFHVHAPSEHAIDGVRFPLELHFVHKSADGKLAVVGVLVQPGDSNAELQKVWKVAPAHAGEGGVAKDVDLAKVFPFEKTNFRYPGSLTTPPCSEHVQWILMQTPITISKDEIFRIEGMFAAPEFPHGNARPLQPLGSRSDVVDLGT